MGLGAIFLKQFHVLDTAAHARGELFGLHDLLDEGGLLSSFSPGGSTHTFQQNERGKGEAKVIEGIEGAPVGF